MKSIFLLALLFACVACGAGDGGGVDVLTDPGLDDGAGEAETLDVRDLGEDIGPGDGGDLKQDDLPADEAGAEDAEAEDIGAEDVTDDGGLGCPPPGALDCSPGTGSGEDCVFVESCFISSVQDAVRWVIANRPELFDTSGDCAIVLDAAAYQQAVADRIDDLGLCGIPDTNSVEEVVVKYNNAYSENFDILASTGCARYGSLIYTSTCIPAWI
jgi:hypothetical protein